MADEQALIEAGLLPGIDFCRYALKRSAAGRVPLAKHVQRCPVCLRRLWVTEAELQGWPPMMHVEAVAILPEMADAFGHAVRDERYQSFYAHVARCAGCERRLAELTFDQRPWTTATRTESLTGLGARR